MRNGKIDDLTLGDLLEIYEGIIRHRCYCPCECHCFDGIPEQFHNLTKGQIQDAIENLKRSENEN